MYKIFGIKNCNTVQNALAFLEQKKIRYEFVDFKKHKPTAEDIQRWSQKFPGLPVNKQGLTFKKFKEQFEKQNESGQVKLILENPSMIKRPILEKDGEVVCFGFDPEIYKKLK